MNAYLIAMVALLSAHLGAQEPLQYFAILTGAQALPPNTSSFAAHAIITLSGNYLGVEIVQGLPSLNGDAFVQTFSGSNLLTLPFANAIQEAPLMPLSRGAIYYYGGVVLSDNQVGDLKAGRLYAAIASAQYPNGEIRGQIAPIVIMNHPFPINPHVIQGDPVTFTASASGAPPLVFQWQFSASSNTWSDISGATNTGYTIAGVQASNAGYYRLAAKNTNGAAVSRGAKLDYFASGTQSITNLRYTPSGLQFKQPEVQGYSYIIYASTNAGAPFSNWVATAIQVAGTHFITDLASTNDPQRFYRSEVVRWAPGTPQFTAYLTGAQAIPPNDGLFSAQASISVALDGNALGVEIVQYGPISGGDAFVRNSTGENLFTIPWAAVTFEVPAITRYRAIFALSDPQRAELQAGGLFVAIASAQYPNGQIRGQIVPVSP